MSSLVKIKRLEFPMGNGRDVSHTSCGKRLVAFALAVCAFYVAPFAVQAAGGTFGGGNGTSGNPYIVQDAADLDAVRNGLSLYYKLGNNVDLTVYLASGGAGYTKWGASGWLPIGTYFQGNFDGNGYKITGLWANRQGTSNVGLFAYLYNATVKNLGIENCTITGEDYTGGLVGYSYGSTAISNCYVTGNVTGNLRVGGLAGYATGTTNMTGSYVTGSITGFQYVGGLAGSNANIISDCYAICNVSGTYAGGLVGNNASPASISNCYAGGNVSGTAYVGGLAGYNSATIRNSVAANSSVVTTTTVSYINRVAGYNYGGTYQNNYVLNSMIVQNNVGAIAITDNSSGIAGMAYPMDSLSRLIFYSRAANWNNASLWNIDTAASSSSIWNICNNKWLPLLRWQNSSCNFNVITVSAGMGGTITPGAFAMVNSGGNQKFTFVPNSNYAVDSLLIDGIYSPDSIAVGSYTFNNVMANHTIRVTFKLTCFCGGNGSGKSPYLICTAGQLDSMRLCQNACYKLANNIDLTAYLASGGFGYTKWGAAGWEPIGTSSNPFVGRLNGAGYKIIGLWINRPSTDNVGLFGYTAGGGKILDSLGVDIAVGNTGVYFDYGLNNILKENPPFMNYTNSYPVAEFTTNSAIPSLANKMNPMTVGLKLRFAIVKRREI